MVTWVHVHLVSTPYYSASACPKLAGVRTFQTSEARPTPARNRTATGKPAGEMCSFATRMLQRVQAAAWALPVERPVIFSCTPLRRPRLRVENAARKSLRLCLAAVTASATTCCELTTMPWCSRRENLVLPLAVLRPRLVRRRL